jgi:predicted flap endonuclease-1-like 5' DNA nuclease
VARIDEIEGIGESYAAKLREAGISTTDALLEKGGTPNGRETIAKTAGITGTLVLRWVNHADLFRINGVASEMSELLEAAGVDSVAELARRAPANLHRAIVDTNEQKKLTRRVPTEAQVGQWIEEAKRLPRAVSH